MRILKEDTIALVVDFQEKLMPVMADAEALEARTNILLKGLIIMFLNKFIVLLCGIFFLFSSFTYAIDYNYNLKSINNTSSPKINAISPINAQQYIISKKSLMRCLQSPIL